MKKKLVILLLASAVLAGCAKTDGSVSENTTSLSQTVAQSPIEAVNPVDFEGTVMEDTSGVQIPDYADIKVSVPTYTLSQQQISQKVQEEFANLVYQADKFVYTDTDKDTVENGDIVLMDFLSKTENQDDDTAEDTHLEIGSGSYIDGFEDGLIGMKVGDTKELSLQFPSDYPNEELAGKPVTFIVTIKKIQTRDIPEMTDDVIKSFGIEPQTVSEFTNGVTQNLSSQLLSQNETAKITAIENALIEQVAAEPSEENVQKIVDKMLQYFKQEADEHGESLEDYFAEHMDVSLEDYTKDCQPVAQDMAKKMMIFEAIAKKEGIFVSEEAVQRQAENDYQGMGYSSVEEYMENVDKQALYDFILKNSVIGKIEDRLSITNEEPQDMMVQ